MRIRFMVGIFIVAFAFSATACGGGNNTPSATTSGKASSTVASTTTVAASANQPAGLCSALTTANVGQIIGVTVVNATPTGLQCSFAGLGVVVNVGLAGLGTDPTAAKQSFEAAKQNNATDATDITGFGDAAYWYLGDDPNLFEFRVLKGHYAIGIYVVHEPRHSGEP